MMTDTPERKAALATLRWLLFDTLGYVFGWDTASSPRVFRLITPDGREDTTRLERHIIGVLSRAGVADWPRDDGAALALCLTIGAKPMMYVTIMEFLSLDEGGPSSYMARFYYPLKDTEEHTGNGDTPAEALARLALEAKRGNDD